MTTIEINDTLSVEVVRLQKDDTLISELRIVRKGAGIVTLRPGEIDDLYKALAELAARAAAHSQNRERDHD